MTSVVFVRHGESESNFFIHQDKSDPDLGKKINALGDPSLTILGAEQAVYTGKYLAALLKGRKVRVLVSPFKRTRETAGEFIRQKENENDGSIDLQKLPLLQEYTKPEKCLPKQIKLVHHESWTDFTDQIRTFVDQLEDHCQENDHPIVIFGHSLYLSALVSYISSGKEKMPEKRELVFRFPNCSITTFEFSQGNWRIFNVASLAHLPKTVITGTECPFGDPQK